MGIPFRSISALAAAAAYAASSGWLPSVLPRLGFLAAFAVTWVLQFWLWFIWAVLLYPKLFSPLRHLPGPSNGSLWNGQYSEIVRQPTGAPMLEW